MDLAERKSTPKIGCTTSATTNDQRNERLKCRIPTWTSISPWQRMRSPEAFERENSEGLSIEENSG